jgi:selenide,water dikinase
LPPITDPAVLVGTSTADDAAVYKISDEQALVTTLDFFTPVVDSPYDFGAISAANSISDVYAMGGRPILAMNIVGYPRNNPLVPLSTLADILKGGADKAAEAGMNVIGGHTIDDSEPKYGMSVTGMIHPDKIWRNVGAHPGDHLVLTKPLGTGIISAAMRAGVAPAEVSEHAISMMSMLNKKASELAHEVDVHACTDVTGFGLLGHLREMLGSELDAQVHLEKVPMLMGAHALAVDGHIPGGSRRNLASLEDVLEVAPGIDETHCLILCDAQTSGGLLFALSPEDAVKHVENCRAAGVPAVQLGEFQAGSGKINVVD